MVIKQYNISPETLRHPSQMREGLIDELVACKPDIPELLEAKRLGYAMTANGAMFDKSRLGWFPKIIQKFFDKRVAYKKEMKKWQKELERLLQQPEKDNAAINHAISMIAVYDARQMAVKIAINSLYGALGNEGFRYYNHSMAEGITTSGQLASRYIERKVVELLNNMLGKDKPAEEWVVGGDTDSRYFTMSYIVDKLTKGQDYPLSKLVDLVDAIAAQSIEPHIEKSYEELADYLGAYTNAMSMKREVIADVGIWRAKKNYILRVHDNEGVRYAEPHIKMMGIETARSELPDFARTEMVECLKLILDDDKEAELQQRLETFHEYFIKRQPNDIARNKGVNGIEEWSNGFVAKPRAPFNVRASVSFNRLRQEKRLFDIAPIESGDKVKIIRLTEPNPTGYYYFAYKDDLPPEMGLHEYIDYEGQYEQMFLSPIKSFTDLLGWKTEASALDDFF